MNLNKLSVRKIRRDSLKERKERSPSCSKGRWEVGGGMEVMLMQGVGCYVLLRPTSLIGTANVGRNNRIDGLID